MKLFGGVGRMTAAAGLAVIRIMMRIREFFDGIFSIMTAAAGEIVRILEDQLPWRRLAVSE